MAKTKVKLLKHAVIDGSVEWAGTEVTVDDQTLGVLIASESVKAPAALKDVVLKDAATVVPKEIK